MSLGKTISNEIIAWSIVAMVVVILSIVLYGFRTATTSGFVANCKGANLTLYSACQLNASLGTYVSAFLEPKNWVSIVIIAVIGIGIIGFFVKKFKGMGRSGKDEY